MNTLPTITALIYGITATVLILLLIKFNKQNIRKLELIENEFRRPDTIAIALIRIADIINYLKEKIKKMAPGRILKKSNRIKIEREKEEILQKLDLLDLEIQKIGKDKDADTAKIIVTFETIFIEFKNFLEQSSLKLHTKGRKKKLESDIKNNLFKIHKNIEFIKLDCGIYTDFSNRLREILSEYGKYLEMEKKNLTDLIEEDLKEGFSMIKDREKKDFTEMKQETRDFIVDFKDLKADIQQQSNRLSSSSDKMEHITSQIEVVIPGFENLKKEFSAERKNLDELKDKFAGCNNNLDSNISKIEELQEKFGNLQTSYGYLKEEISNVIDGQNKNFTQSNINLKEIVGEMNAAMSHIGILKTQFEGMTTGICQDTVKVNKNLSGNIQHLQGIMEEIKKSIGSYEYLMEKILKEINTQKSDLEDKIKKMDEMSGKFIENFDTEKFLKWLNEATEKANTIKDQLAFCIKFIKEQKYLGNLTNGEIRQLMFKIKDEPVFSKEYHKIVINFFKDVVNFGQTYKNKWYMKHWNRFINQLNTIIPTFLHYELKTIYDVYLENKPLDFNLKDVSKNDLKEIINQNHWIQIWEPLLRWTYFFKAYLGEDSAYLVERHHHYAQKTEKLFQELGYRIELYSPLEIISEELVETNQVKEISNPFVFLEDILPNIKHLEIVKKVVGQIGHNTDKKLILYVDQVGLVDDGQRIRESKLLFYSPLMMKHTK